MNLTEFIKDLKVRNDQSISDIDLITYNVMQEALNEVRLIWPVDTGESKRNWELIKIKDCEYSIINSKEYVPYVHKKNDTTLIFDEVLLPLIDTKYIPKLEGLIIEYLENTLNK